MTDTNEFEVDVKIDPYRLDEAWVGQPSLYSKYALMSADANKEHATAKEDLEVVKAELYQQITSDPEEFGMTKTTEPAIKAAITLHSACIAAQRAVIEAKHAVDICNGGVQAFEHRKAGVEGLVKLFLNDYYSRLRVSGESKERMADVERKAARRKGGVRHRKGKGATE